MAQGKGKTQPKARRRNRSAGLTFHIVGKSGSMSSPTSIAKLAAALVTPSEELAAFQVMDKSGDVQQTIILRPSGETQEIPVGSVLPSVLNEKSAEKLATAIAGQTAELAKFRKTLRVEQRAHARQRRKKLWVKIAGGFKDAFDVTADTIADGARFLGRKAKGLIISSDAAKPATKKA